MRFHDMLLAQLFEDAVSLGVDGLLSRRLQIKRLDENARGCTRIAVPVFGDLPENSLVYAFTNVGKSTPASTSCSCCRHRAICDTSDADL